MNKKDFMALLADLRISNITSFSITYAGTGDELENEKINTIKFKENNNE